jgi:hypothetical protein
VHRARKLTADGSGSKIKRREEPQSNDCGNTADVYDRDDAAKAAAGDFKSVGDGMSDEGYKNELPGTNPGAQL